MQRKYRRDTAIFGRNLRVKAEDIQGWAIKIKFVIYGRVDEKKAGFF